MSRLKFYYNTVGNMSERVRYYNTPDLWESELKLIAVSKDYIWNEAHLNEDLVQFTICSSNLKNVTTKLIPDLGLVIDADNVEYAIPKDDRGKIINAFIICNSTKPIVIIENYEELPLTLNGSLLTVNFFNGIERIFAFNINSYVINNALLYQERSIEIPRPEDNIIRNNINLPYSDEFDKSSLTGKNNLYKDISISGKAHPLTGDLVSVIGKTAINQSLRTILLANKYDRPFSSKDIAGNLNAFLFEFNDDTTNLELKTGIAIAINNHEPRVTIIDIITESVPESYQLSVTIFYAIKTTNITQEFNLILERA